MTNLFEVFGNYRGFAESLFECAIVLGLFLGIVIHFWRDRIWKDRFKKIFKNRTARFSFYFLMLFSFIAILDSIALPIFEIRGEKKVWVENRSLLELIYNPELEETLSAPFSKTTFEARRATMLKKSHPLGTNLNGRDVLLLGLKGCKTALIIGGLTTIVVIPLGILFGVLAGYFGKKIDAIITYVFSTLESIPEILLLICLMKLMGQGLLQLSVALGITTWVGLCRVVRGETMKLRELPYVQAAKALGSGNLSIIRQHIIPNLMHIVLIASVLRFSGLVLSEAILSYLGIGVGPETGSWGAMIDQGRDDLARDPVVWWNIFTAGIFLFSLILSANIFGDRVRDVLDPRLKGMKE